jgi:hypothetical protein
MRWLARTTVIIASAMVRRGLVKLPDQFSKVKIFQSRAEFYRFAAIVMLLMLILMLIFMS